MVRFTIGRALVGRRDVKVLGWSSSEMDPTDRAATPDAATGAKPGVVALAAARASGPVANGVSPVKSLTENLRIPINLMQAETRRAFTDC